METRRSVWYFAWQQDKIGINRIRRIKDSYLPLNRIEAEMQVKDAIFTAMWKYKLKGEEFQIELAEPLPKLRTKRTALAFFKVASPEYFSYSLSGARIRAVNFTTADPAMRALKYDWLYSDPFAYQRTPTLVGKIPDLLDKVTDSGVIHHQYSHRPPPSRRQAHDTRIARNSVHQYGRFISLQSAKHRQINRPTY